MKKTLKLSNFNHQSDESTTISYFSLYRFATSWDWLLIFVGVFGSFLKAIPSIWTTIAYGELTALLIDRTDGTDPGPSIVLLRWFGGGEILRPNASDADIYDAIIHDSISYAIHTGLSTILQLVSGIICVDCFNRTAIRQMTRMRIKFFESVMKQEIAWHDIEGGKSNFTVRISDDIEKIKTGIAEHVSHFLFIIFSFILFVISSFIYGWELTLMIICYIPIVFITNLIIGKIQAKSNSKELDAYSKAANVVEEVLGSVRTVFAFGGEQIEVERYKKHLEPAKQASTNKGISSSISDGITRVLFLGCCAVSFWFGVRWVLDDRYNTIKAYTPASLIIIFLNLITGADNIGRLMPYMEIFAAARGAAKSVFSVIDRQSNIDSTSSNGEVLDQGVSGQVEFRNVSFSYPTRSDIPVLQNLNLKIQAGQSVALVGSSGNGKSTCLGLLQRFYNLSEGEILIDNHDIKSVNLHSLRSLIATVSQEPILFSTSIEENIRYGKPSASHQEIINAAINSGADAFIKRLPAGYKTLVGEKGSQLSGGQKQRIAIARALIQNPKILLLDEATSALDYQSEKYVQKALDSLSHGRTTIVVSHRLSAIRSADRIVFLEKGEVVEDGTHNQLLELKGRYYELIKSHASHETDADAESEKSNKNAINIDEARRQILNESTNRRADSISSTHESADDYDMDQAVDYGKTFKRIVQLVEPNWLTLFLAIVASLLLGTTLPLFSILFAEVLGIFAIPDMVEALYYVKLICAVFIVLGVVMFSAAVIQTYYFNRAGANLTQLVRAMTFQAMLSQECGWFDDARHSVGILSTRLSSDAANIQMAVGYPLSIILQSVSTVVFGIIISLATSFELSAICFGAIPLMVGVVILEARYLAKSETAEKSATSVGIKIASESINNIRTVACLRREKEVIRNFTREMSNVESLILKKLQWRGLINSISQSIPFLFYGIALFYGGIMVAKKQISYKDVIRVAEAMLFGVIVMSQTLVFAPTITCAFTGAHRIFKIIDRKPRIASPIVSNKSRKPDRANDIEFKRIDFRYPTRPDIQILDEFSLHIEEGKTYAFVGPSGCGKSTCIQLLQRLYDPERGRIFIGLDEISSDISLSALRSKLSIVSQEPVLFDRTIAENIAYGDNGRDVNIDEIIEAAKLANVHNFIVKLPMGYDTSLGSRSTQLSGGQKQRIAIARALICKPKILLLDEATSALDLQSEKIVQDALDLARTGRTCIIIAHRLSTIQNADVICVFQNGRLVESGTHTQLMAMNSCYTHLYNAQKEK